jgi:hypothetical protein
MNTRNTRQGPYTLRMLNDPATTPVMFRRAGGVPVKARPACFKYKRALSRI